MRIEYDKKRRVERFGKDGPFTLSQGEVTIVLTSYDLALLMTDENKPEGNTDEDGTWVQLKESIESIVDEHYLWCANGAHLYSTATEARLCAMGGCTAPRSTY